MSYKKKELITLREHLSAPPVFWWWFVLLIFRGLFVCCPIMCLYVLSGNRDAQQNTELRTKTHSNV
jgi:hypothetical protein